MQFKNWMETLKLYDPDKLPFKERPKKVPYNPEKGWPVIIMQGDYEGQEGRLIGNQGALSKVHMPDGTILYLASPEYRFPS